MKFQRALRPLVVGLLLVGTVACKGKGDRHEHAADHVSGHDHHEQGHGHGDGPVVRITMWSEQLELFSEHEAAVAGSQVSLLAHFTVLEGFQALVDAQVKLELSGPAAISVQADAPVRPGIYVLEFVPPTAGTYRGRVVVSGAVEDVLEDLVIEVYDTEATAAASVAEHDDEAFIELLKEQQWKVPFSTAFARAGTLSASIEVSGVIATPPGGSAEVSAPVSGRIVVPTKGLPLPGQTVKKGEVLAVMAPFPGSPEDAVRAALGVSESEARLDKARAALARAERLVSAQAVAAREVEDARREVEVAKAALQAAEDARRLHAGAAAGTGTGSWRLLAPIDGTVVEVKASPGASVEASTVLFRIVDTSELWVHARVPEQDAAQLRIDRDARFQLAGLDEYLPIDLTGDDATASLITVGRTVDPRSRTVDVIYALREPDPRLRVGGLVRVSLPAGADFSGVIVPRQSILDEDGRAVVYVQVDGEHFEERTIRTGPRHGDEVGVLEGLAVADRVAVTGVTMVRLSGKAGDAGGHGHIH